MITCQCPAATAIPDMPNVACEESFGQIQKAVFQRLRKADGTVNSFTSATSITLKASWTANFSALDGAKMVITPWIYSPADSGGDARMSSGGNDDLGGIPQTLGSEPVQFTGQFRGIPQSVVKAIEPLICEANAGNLGVYLIDENGNIEGIQDQTTPTTYYPIPIRALHIGNKLHGNYDARDNNAISWYYGTGYSTDIDIVTPSDFNPLTDLTNATNA